MNKQTLISTIIIVLAIVVALVLLQRASSKPSIYNEFAACLGEKGATFYGAFWCPHCGDQKKAFGRAEEFLPYVECSTPDGQGQTEVCIEKGIESYPTWEFADGSRVTGEQTMSFLAEKTGCELPSENEDKDIQEGEASPITES